MKKFKILFYLFAIMVVSSCKKSETEKQPTFEEMKIIVSQSPELNQVFKLDDEISIIRQAAFYKNLGKFKSSLKVIKTFSSNTNKPKTELDFKQFFDEHYGNKGDEIISKIKTQLELVKKFGEKYPVFNKFSEDQRKELLNDSFIEFQKNISLTKKLLLVNNSQSQIRVSGDCMGDFNISYNTCGDYYNAATLTIWLGVAYTGGSGLGAALIAQLGAELARAICEDDAANHLQNCMS